jgi:hypothetical protein
MIKSTDMIDTKKFNRKFKKSFNNFCQKSPLELDITMNDNGQITIQTNVSEEPIVYEINYMIVPDNIDFCVKKNIKYIKDTLEQHYPILNDKISDEEKAYRINKIMSEKRISFDEALEELLQNLKTENIGEPRYKIMRIVMGANEINVFDLKEERLKLYKLTIPLIFFMEKVFENIHEASMIFQDKAEFISNI